MPVAPHIEELDIQQQNQCAVHLDYIQGIQERMEIVNNYFRDQNVCE